MILASAVLTLGVLSGTTLVDPHLGDYQWDTHARPAYGAFAMVSAGPFDAGVRAWHSSTAQRLELPDGPVSPRVGSTTLELVGRADVARWAGARFGVTAGAGRLHLGWQPDHLTVTTGATTSEVALDPIAEWIGSAGVSIERGVAGPWTAGISLERSFFRLDTAHRSGTAVIDQRESFGDWDARISIARQFHLGPATKGAPR